MVTHAHIQPCTRAHTHLFFYLRTLISLLFWFLFCIWTHNCRHLKYHVGIYDEFTSHYFWLFLLSSFTVRMNVIKVIVNKWMRITQFTLWRLAVHLHINYQEAKSDAFFLEFSALLELSNILVTKIYFSLGAIPYMMSWRFLSLY